MSNLFHPHSVDFGGDAGFRIPGPLNLSPDIKQQQSHSILSEITELFIQYFCRQVNRSNSFSSGSVQNGIQSIAKSNQVACKLAPYQPLKILLDIGPGAIDKSSQRKPS